MSRAFPELRRVRRPSTAALRLAIAALLRIAPDDLREWNTVRCPECHRDTRRQTLCPASGLPHLPPIYYVLAPEQPDGDMPLGVGDSSAAALADLLWTLRTTCLLESLSIRD